MKSFFWSYCGHQHSLPVAQAPALDMQGVWASYQDGKPALKGVSASIPCGSCTALVGSNGAGKSTLLKVAANLLPIHEGQVRIFGHPLGVCHHRVVYLPQRSEIDWKFPITVEEFVLTGRYVYLGWFKRPGQEDRRRVNEALLKLDVADLSDRQISKLSGGQQQRVLIARALVQNADLLLLDEPLNAIDTATRQTVAQVLQSLKQEGKTVLMATHYYDAAESLFDGAMYLKDGEGVRAPDVAQHDHKSCCSEEK